MIDRIILSNGSISLMDTSMIAHYIHILSMTRKLNPKRDVRSTRSHREKKLNYSVVHKTVMMNWNHNKCNNKETSMTKIMHFRKKVNTLTFERSRVNFSYHGRVYNIDD